MDKLKIMSGSAVAEGCGVGSINGNYRDIGNRDMNMNESATVLR